MTIANRKVLIGIAAKKGKAQVQCIAYDASGASSIQPLSDWIALSEAQALRAEILADIKTQS